MAKSNQFGRTMVEMLGVLALIGILSVACFELFAKAMNTVKANYLMQQVFIKSNELVQNKVVERRKKVDLTLFDNTTGELSYGYSFCGSDTKCAPAVDKDGYFVIRVNGEGRFTSGLCGILRKKITEQEYNGLVDIRTSEGSLKNETCSADTAYLVFIIDSKFEQQGVVHVEVVPDEGGEKEKEIVVEEEIVDEKTDEKSCEEAGGTWCVPGDDKEDYCAPVGTDCCTGVTVGECEACEASTGKVVADSSAYGNECHYDEDTLGYCDNGWGGCVKDNCETNADCKANHYCRIIVLTKSYDSEQGQYNYTFKTKCTPVDEHGNIQVGLDTFTYSKGSSNMNWWNARRWCETQGLNLVGCNQFTREQIEELSEKFDEIEKYKYNLWTNCDSTNGNGTLIQLNTFSVAVTPKYASHRALCVGN